MTFASISRLFASIAVLAWFCVAFILALSKALTAETFTRVLYPDDHTMEGKCLRFFQEYFLIACSLADLIRRFRAAGNDWSTLPDKAAIQLNDTHLQGRHG